MNDVQTIRNYCLVSVLLQRSAANDAWGSPRWRLVGVVPEEGDVPHPPIRSLAHEGEDARTHIWRGLALRLNPESCSNYLMNLSGDRPLLFVICQAEGDGELRPVAATADQQDAVDAQEVDDTVFEIAMPPFVAAWLEEWIPVHWRPGQRKGRQWQKLQEDWPS